MISAIFNIIWNICIMRAGPHQLPTSQLLMLLLLLLHFILGVSLYAVDNSLQEQLHKTGLLLWLLASGLELMLLYGFIQTVLIVRHYQSRILQTMSAVIGCNVLFSVIQLCLLLIYTISDQQKGLISIILLMVFVWSIAVITNILKQAVSISTIPALGLVLLYTFFTLLSLDAVLTLVG